MNILNYKTIGLNLLNVHEYIYRPIHFPFDCAVKYRLGLTNKTLP